MLTKLATLHIHRVGVEEELCSGYIYRICLVICPMKLLLLTFNETNYNVSYCKNHTI